MIHILRESISPPESIVWTMHCGDQCIANDDGELIPNLNFYLENESEKATCPRCIIKLIILEKVLELSNGRFQS